MPRKRKPRSKSGSVQRKVSISLSPELIDLIDEAAARENRSRSNFIETYLVQYIDEITGEELEAAEDRGAYGEPSQDRLAAIKRAEAEANRPSRR